MNADSFLGFMLVRVDDRDDDSYGDYAGDLPAC